MPMSDLYSTPSKCLECKFSNEFDEVVSFRPICLNVDFRYKTLKYQYQIHMCKCPIKSDEILILQPFLPKF